MSSAAAAEGKKGWVQLEREAELADWACAVCSHVQPGRQMKCGRCGKAKPFRKSIEDQAATKIQGVFRSRRALRQLRDVIHSIYTQKYDFKNRSYYYVNNVTGETKWTKPLLLGSEDIALTEEQQLEGSRRDLRFEAMEERDEERRVRKEEAADKKKRQEEEKKLSHWKREIEWSKDTNALICNWKNLTEIHPVVLGMTHLHTLRLIGHQFTVLPYEVGDKLTNLTCLSLSNNKLRRLPENIGKLTKLTSLNVLKNELEVLPRSICMLKSLTSFECANNQLKGLPEDFGSLQALPRVVLELNELETVPASVGRLGCEILQLSTNNIRELPPSIGKCPALHTLYINNNRLALLPDEICDIPNLTNLSLCNNHLQRLPDRLSLMPKLRRLWLDWNRIEFLPPRFEKLGRTLRSLKAEGNPLRQPTLDVVTQGVKFVIQWCQERTSQIEMRRHRTVVEAVLDLLSLVAEKNLVRQEVFEPYYEWGDYKPRQLWYCFVAEAFEKEILPACYAYWRKHEMEDVFVFTPEEVVNSITKFQDPYGAVGRLEELVCFQRCACTDDRGNRKVCIPPRAGYQCQREATLVKMRIVTETEYRMQQMRAQEEQAVKIAVDMAKRQAKAYTQSKDGIEHLKQLSLHRAKLQIQQKKADAIVEGASSAATKRRDAVAAKFADRKERLEEKRDAHIDRIKKEQHRLTMKKERLVGFELEKCEAEIQKLGMALESGIEEDQQLIDLDEEKATALAKLDEDIRVAEEERESRMESALQEAGKKKLTAMSREHSKLARQLEPVVTQEYIDKACTEADNKIRREYRIQETIMVRWNTLILKSMFTTWATWSEDRITRRIEDMRRKIEKKQLEEAEAAAKTDMAQEELVKWVEKFDDFTDAFYYEHAETGETRWERPTLEELKKIRSTSPTGAAPPPMLDGGSPVGSV